MTKKIILSLGALALVTSSLMACKGSCDENGKGNCAPMGQERGMMHSKGGEHRFMQTIMQLDLSDEQRTSIRDIMQAQRAQRVDPLDVALSDNAFDKEAFIKAVNANKEEKVEKRAEVIAKVYALLNDAQKKALKSALMTKPMGKGKGMGCNNSQNANKPCGPRACDK